MRPSVILLIVVVILTLTDIGLALNGRRHRVEQHARQPMLNIVTAGLGLSDLCIATEARYTRHPAASDRVVPFMDYPGAVEHFPSGSFWAPPPYLRFSLQNR
ncbi:MAG: hypothetical protein P8Y63_00735 [Deltaproteobacteria bacterium]|jgi:hypothetical protein